MAKKSNEEVVDELIRRARLSVGKLTKGEACAGEYAAVLARMAGPGEVVVRSKFLLNLVGLAEHAQTYARNFGDFEILADANEAIAEYETLAQGGTDG